MKLLIFAALMALAIGFGLISALTKDRTFIIASGLLFLLTGLVLAGGEKLEVKDGFSKDYKTFENTTVEDSRTYSYSKVQTDIAGINLSQNIGLMLIMFAIYSFYTGVSRKKLRSIFKRN